MDPFTAGWPPYLSGISTTISYDLGSRFQLTVTKEQLHAAETIHDIVPGFLKQEEVTYTKVSIRTVEGDQGTEIVASGTDHLLNPAQLELLRSYDYAGNFMISAHYTERNEVNGSMSRNEATPHLTVVPEREAVNSTGKEALIAYVKSGSSMFAYVVEASKLRPGAVYFTVDPQGHVTQVRLSSSSGYPALDHRVLELVNTLPGTWTPATNGAQEPVEQELRFTFGTVGC
jgi:TonB family protein